MIIQRIYIDTSVVGGFFDEEFAEATKALFERLKNKEIIFLVSSVLQQEISNAPLRVRELLQAYDKDCFELEDCWHIAIATLNKVDVLASWNFKHIVNLDKIKGYNSVNLKMGYAILEIRNPRDLIKYGNN